MTSDASFSNKSPAPTRLLKLVIMASGLARRFDGRNKLLVPFGGEALCLPVFRAARAVASKYPDSFSALVVTSHPAVAALAEDLGLAVLMNDRPEEGQSRSIRLGLAALAPGRTASKADRAPAAPGQSPALAAAELNRPKRPRDPAAPAGSAAAAVNSRPETSPAPAAAAEPQPAESVLFLPADQPFLTAAELERFCLAVRSGDYPLWRAWDGERFGSPTAFDASFYPELMALEGDQGGKIIFKRHPEQVGKVLLAGRSLTDIDTPAALAEAEKQRSQIINNLPKG